MMMTIKYIQQGLTTHLSKPIDYETAYENYILILYTIRREIVKLKGSFEALMINNTIH